MLKWLTIVLVAFIMVMLTISYLYGVALRNAGIIEGRMMLKVAAKDFQPYGHVTNVSSSSYRFWLSTNAVTIDGTRYQCYVEVGGGKFYDEGTLAVTTNYRAPIFPPHF